MEILLEPIKPGSNIDLRTDVGIFWCCPFLSILLGDLPEHHSITLTYTNPGDYPGDGNGDRSGNIPGI